MYSLYKFTTLAALAISMPAAAQTVADPPIGSQDGTSNMPKATATIPDRVRTPDTNSWDGVRVRSDLADKPGTPPAAVTPKEPF
jgi:hypothetical protein